MDKDKFYTPEQLREYADEIDDLHTRLLYEMDEAGAYAVSEQYYLLAVNALDSSQRYMRMAAIEQSRGIAAVRLATK
jgi:hypothetical protein